MRARLGLGPLGTPNRAPAILAPAKQLYYYSLYYKANFSSGSWNGVLGNPRIGFLGPLTQRGSSIAKLLYYKVNVSLQRPSPRPPVFLRPGWWAAAASSGTGTGSSEGSWRAPNNLRTDIAKNECELEPKKKHQKKELSCFFKVDTLKNRLGFAWRLRSTFRERRVSLSQ